MKKSGAARAKTDWKDERLQEWGAWVRCKLEGQGWGGSVDRDPVAHAMRGPRDAYTYSNPVLWECEAIIADKQSQDHRMHTLLGHYPRQWRRVAWLRYVGRPEYDTRRGAPKKAMAHRGDIQIGRNTHLPIVIVLQRPRVVWSGMLPWEDVATESGLSLRTVKAIGAQVRRLISVDLGIDREVRLGHFGPEGRKQLAA